MGPALADGVPNSWCTGNHVESAITSLDLAGHSAIDHRLRNLDEIVHQAECHVRWPREGRWALGWRRSGYMRCYFNIRLGFDM